MPEFGEIQIYISIAHKITTKRHKTGRTTDSCIVKHDRVNESVFEEKMGLRENGKMINRWNWKIKDYFRQETR